MAKFIVANVAEGLITLKAPGANYENTFKLAGSAGAIHAGDKVRGTIFAPAWKAEAVSDGGNYVEPLLGRPRRMQGEIRSVNAAANQLTVHVGYNVTVTLPERYSASAYAVGTRIGWDNIEIPTFQPEA